jgi:DNA-binding response OmpR family regulator
MRTVWGEGWGADEHLVEVHVGNMRRKLAQVGGGATFVRTVRGVGYRMEDPAAL